MKNVEFTVATWFHFLSDDLYDFPERSLIVAEVF